VIGVVATGPGRAAAPLLAIGAEDRDR